MGKKSIFRRNRDKTPEPLQDDASGKQAVREGVRSSKGTGSTRSRRQNSRGKIIREQKNSVRKLKKKREGIKEIAKSMPQDNHRSKDESSRVRRDNGEISDPESVYVSRKLLIRQMQKQIAQEVHLGRDSVSEYDSWSDLEENFALAYEPIPLSIRMDTWRKMSKREIIRKVNSQKIRKDFEYLTHSEILEKISEMQANARYLSQKFGIVHLRPGVDQHERDEKEEEEKGEEEEEEEEKTDTDDNISRASFVSREDTYVSRAQIIDKIYERRPGLRPASSSKSQISESKSVESPNSRAHHEQTTSRAQNNQSRAHQGQSRARHDSWSSRASSILKDPEAIYVSRGELLKNINIFENPNFDKQLKDPKKRVEHDSWSSRASSILAAVHKHQENDPLYISRVELLEKLQIKSLETLSGISQTSFDSDSDQSTVKSVNMNDDDYDDKSPKQRKWKSQKDVFETELTRVKHESAPKKLPQKSLEVSSPFHGSPRAPERRRHSNASQLGPATPPRGIYSSQRRISAENRNSIKQDDQERRKHFPSYETHAEAMKNDKLDESIEEWDTCSCATCHTCQQTDCSCSEVSKSSLGSNSSAGTVVGVGEESDESSQSKILRKHSDIYHINGSEHSKSSSKGSKSSSKGSKFSNKSTNYDPLPHNGINTIKQKQLSEHTTNSIQRSTGRKSDSQVSKRSNQSERRYDTLTNERQGGSTNEKGGSVSSKKSWTNEKFEKLYEPVTVTELKRKRQMKQIRNHLRTMAPDLDKAVQNINTAKRKRVYRQVRDSVTSQMNLDDLSEEDLGKHLDAALRQALGGSLQINIGHMYVPMEKNPSNSKMASRENTDYDTFGSIDSLIFEPKIPTEEDILEVQDEITQSFEYLEEETYSGHNKKEEFSPANKFLSIIPEESKSITEHGNSSPTTHNHKDAMGNVKNMPSNQQIEFVESSNSNMNHEELKKLGVEIPKNERPSENKRKTEEHRSAESRKHAEGKQSSREKRSSNSSELERVSKDRSNPKNHEGERNSEDERIAGSQRHPIRKTSHEEKVCTESQRRSNGKTSPAEKSRPGSQSSKHRHTSSEGRESSKSRKKSEIRSSPETRKRSDRHKSSVGFGLENLERQVIIKDDEVSGVKYKNNNEIITSNTTSPTHLESSRTIRESLSPSRKVSPSVPKQLPQPILVGKHVKNAVAVGKTSFAERVRLFQSLTGRTDTPGNDEGHTDGEIKAWGSPIRAHSAQTTWKEQALLKSDSSGRSSISSGSSRSTHSSGSTIVYNMNSTASTASNSTAFYAVNPDSGTSSVTYSTTGNSGRQLINDKFQGYSKSKRIEESVEKRDVHKMNRKHKSERLEQVAEDDDNENEIYDDYGDINGSKTVVEAEIHSYRHGTSTSNYSYTRDSSIYSVGNSSDYCACSDCPECSYQTKSFRTSDMVGIDSYENNNNSNHNNNNSNHNNNNSNHNNNNMDNRNQKNNKNKKIEEDKDESPPLPHPRQSPRGDEQLQNSIPPPLPPKSRSPRGNTQQSTSSSGNVQASSIVLVGNLRAKSRSAEASLNIEKRREKNGVIIDDEDDISSPEAPLKERIYEEKVEDRKSRVKKKSANSSKRRVARSQFRTVTPEPEDSIDESREYIQEPRWREHKEFTTEEEDYYSEDQLLTTRDHLQEEMGNLTVQILKSGNSEMGDSGISSNPASISTPGMSPKSDSLEETKAQDVADKIIPPGKKRDTMLRELKSKLKERFPSNGLSSPPAASRHSEPSQQFIQEKHAEVGPKLSKLFTDRTIDPKSKAPMDPYGSMRKTRLIGEREEWEESKMEFLQKRASLRRVSKGGESSASSHLETVEESDTCDCESSCYNSEYDREFLTPPNPPPTAASNRYSCTPDQGQRSPDRRYNRSTEQRHNESQDQRHNRSPEQRHDGSPERRRNQSPQQKYTRSPDRRHKGSPAGRYTRSPDRRHNGSAEERYTRSPDRRHNGSPEGRYTRSPDRQLNGSPEERYTRSPDRRHNGAPEGRYTRSPDRQHNGSPEERYTRSPDRRHNGSPERQINGSPDQRNNGSPDQRYSSSPNHPPTSPSLKNNERPTSSKSQISDVSKLSLSEKRELVYGPGGIFGSSGPFSTPGVSRYPEPTKPRSKHDQGYTEDASLTSCRSISTVTATSDSAMFAEDRSDKSQYVANTVIKAASPTSPPPKSGKSSDPHSSSRLENYRAEGWIQEKQLRMMSWITRTQQTR